jgi:hypothetical protein
MSTVDTLRAGLIRRAFRLRLMRCMKKRGLKVKWLPSKPSVAVVNDVSVGFHYGPRCDYYWNEKTKLTVGISVWTRYGRWITVRESKKHKHGFDFEALTDSILKMLDDHHAREEERRKREETINFSRELARKLSAELLPRDDQDDQSSVTFSIRTLFGAEKGQLVAEAELTGDEHRIRSFVLGVQKLAKELP